MKRILAWSLIVVLSLSMIVVLHDQQEMRERQRHLESYMSYTTQQDAGYSYDEHSFVEILTENAWKQHGHGTGTVISPHLILTAQHVINGKKVIMIRTADNDVHGAVIVYEDPLADIAVLRVENELPIAWVLEISGRDMQLADAVEVNGFPMGLPFTKVFGYVCSVEYFMTLNEHTYQSLDVYDLMCAPGNSGSAVLYKGKIVGIVVAIHFELGYTYVVPTEFFLEEVKELL